MALTVKLWATCGVSARTYGFSLLPESLRQEARAVTRANVAISCTAGDCYATRGNVFDDAAGQRRLAGRMPATATPGHAPVAPAMQPQPAYEERGPCPHR